MFENPFKKKLSPEEAEKVKKVKAYEKKAKKDAKKIFKEEGEKIKKEDVIYEEALWENKKRGEIESGTERNKEQIELIENSALTISHKEIREPNDTGTYRTHSNYFNVYTIDGLVDGKKVELKKTKPSPENKGSAALVEKYAGVVDGESMPADIAEDLYKKYAPIASERTIAVEDAKNIPV